ncbi:MAG: glycosyltransferase [Candidatus Aenigmatarchaeota archaeon]
MERVLKIKRIKNPKFSIIIPTLNEEKYIENTLLSIKWQNFDLPYEIIVSDSNSKDKTIEIAKKYANKIVITNKKGIALGRNLGAKYAEGEYLLFVDADTILLPNALKEIYKEIKRKKVTLVSLPVLPSEFDMTILLYYAFYDVFSKTTVKLKNPQIAGMVICCKRKDFIQVGGFNEEYNIVEDYDFSSKIGKLGEVKIVDLSLALTSPRRILKWGKLNGAVKYLLLYIAYVSGIKKLVNKLGSSIYKPVR